MLQDVKDLTASGINKGLNTQYNLLTLQKDQSPNMMNVKVNYDGTLEKRLGSNTQNSVVFSNSALASFSPNTTNLLNGLVSYWNLNEASGTRNDSIGNVPILDNGGVSYASGIKGQAALFNIANKQSLSNPSASSLSGNKNFSISSWFYMTSTMQGIQRTILAKRDTPSGKGMVTLLHFDTDFSDSNIPPKTYIASGVSINSSFQKFGVGSAKFANSTDKLTTTQSTDFDFGTGDFCVDFWVNFIGFGTAYLFDIGWTDVGNGISIQYASGNLNVFMNGALLYSVSQVLNIGAFYHIAISRTGTSLKLFLNGNSIDTRTNSTNITSSTYGCTIGNRNQGGFSANAYIDEFRIIKGDNGGYSSNFSVPINPYSNSTPMTSFEYWLYVDTDNLLTFESSSSGLEQNGRVKASSFGTIGTATWYNSVAWIDSTNSLIGVSVNLAFNTSAYTNGMFVGTAPFSLASVNANNSLFFDGRIDETGYWNLVLNSANRAEIYNVGSGNTYQSSFAGYPWSSFDFGASSIRWLTVAAGTGVLASSNLGVVWTTIATDRSATYQYFDRSKNVMILTSDNYDNPLYWAGSIGTFASIIGTSTPLCKYSINFQGFLILLNSNTRKRSFNYIDENFQLSSTGWLNFDLPSSADDEITAVFILRRYLYVSTRYKIYRVSYVGGNPDWQFVEVKSWGFIPRTPKKVVISNQQQGQTSAYSIGEVVVGLTWDRKLRIFDGSGDQILSNNIEKDNGMCDFALDKISYFGSGPVISFAEIDPIPNVYRLCVAIGQDSQNTTHFINYDGRSQALYPYSNMKFNCMCVAESANRQFLMAFDRNGYCHMMDSGNLDGNTTPINDLYESPLMYEKTPSQSSKGHKTDLFFTNTTSGTLYYEDRIDFSNEWKFRKKFVINGSNQSLMHYESIDVPETYNTYQYRISTSSGQSNPYRLQRYDHFTKGLGIGRNV